jgi:hypothetical protein
VKIVSNGATAVMNLNLGGTGTDANAATGGATTYTLDEQAGSDFNVFEKANTFAGSRNSGTVIPMPLPTDFDDLATPPTLPTVP